MTAVNSNFEPVTSSGGEADLSLLRRFVETGDPAAFGKIVQRYGRLVYAVSFRILGDPGRAQDVAQETFFRLMQQPRLVTQSLAGWLHRSATHVALDVRRSERARSAREQRYARQAYEDAKALTQESVRDSAWAELSPLLDEALDDLPQSKRMLLVRHFLQGVRQEDLANEQDISAATISRRIKSALAELQTRLNQKGVSFSAATLIPLMMRCSSHPASAGFAAEMCKMKLFASAKQVSFKPAGGGSTSTTGNLQLRLSETPLKAKLGFNGLWYGIILAVMIAYLIALALSTSARSPGTARPPSGEPRQHASTVS